MAVVIDARLATYRDCTEVLALDEVADLVEILAVRHENERRAADAAERRAQKKKP